MTINVNLEVVERTGKKFVLFGDEEFELLEPKSAGSKFLSTMGSNFVRSSQAQLANYGVSVGSGKTMAGEFVLSNKLSALTSVGMPNNYKCITVNLRNDAISVPYPILFSTNDLENVLTSLRSRQDHEEGVFGPRGSVFVTGVVETRGTWPLRQNVLKATNWMVRGNKNDISHMLRENSLAALKVVKLTLDVVNMNKTLSR